MAAKKPQNTQNETNLGQKEANSDENTQKVDENDEISAIEAKTAEFAKELLDLIISTHGKKIVKWNSAFAVYLPGVKAIVEIKYEVP